MKLEEAKEIMELFVKNIAVEGVKVFELKDACKVALQELERLQKENEELRKRFRRYGDVDSVRLAQIKEIEESVPKYYIDKAQIQDLLKEE